MTYPEEIKKWGEFWTLYRESDKGVAYRRSDANRKPVGFVVFRKKGYPKDYAIKGNVIAKAGAPMIPGETAFGTWAWNYLRESENLALKKLESL